MSRIKYTLGGRFEHTMNDHDRIAELLASAPPVKWLFAGDSIAHGAQVTMGWRDYTELFSERVRWEMSRLRDCVIKTAASGWRITNIEADLDWSVLQYHPHVVSLAVGTNDCANGTDAVDAFRSQYERVIEKIRKQTGAAIILHTPAEILPLDELRAPYLPAYADAIRSVAESTGSILIDHHAHWAGARDRGVLAFWLGDPTHPNEYGHRAMAHLMFQRLNIWDPSSPVCRLFVP
jgi:acyl-CoA thioesterase I